MSDQTCEHCGGPLWGEPVIKVLRGTKHTFCTSFCFHLYFYQIPKTSYAELEKMYGLPQYHKTTDVGLDKIREEMED
jgi:hypothetical protein